jgi:acyl-CoA reductase-like NAD-dependent aldehyde dehydrogenase
MLTLAKHVFVPSVIVVDEVADEFIALFANKINLLKQGDPMMEGINMGPLARLDLAEKLKINYKISTTGREDNSRRSTKIAIFNPH